MEGERGSKEQEIIMDVLKKSGEDESGKRHGSVAGRLLGGVVNAIA